MPSMRREAVELQVAIHDLVERAPAGAAVRVCRALASRTVSLDVPSGQHLAQVLAGLAAQVEARWSVDSSAAGGQALPTLSCPGGAGDYLVIGAARRRPRVGG